MKKKDASEFDKMIGERIWSRRVELGMSRHHVAAQVDISHQQLQKYEKGVNRITAGRLYDIANVLGEQISYFIRDKEEGEVVPERARYAIEISRNASKITDRDTQEAVLILTKVLARNGGEDGNIQSND